MSPVRSTKALEITPDLVQAADETAKSLGVAHALHECDQILAYIVEHDAQSIAIGPAAGVSSYFHSGKADAEKIAKILNRLDLKPGDEVLEFASGFGRVTRHLTRYNLTACDIHTDAVDFINNEFKIRAIGSAIRPDDFNPGKRYKFIFVLSLFSHLPQELFRSWLSRLVHFLAPGGYLIFTANGAVAAQRVALLRQTIEESTGFGFLPISDQKDLQVEIYGSSVATFAYVARIINDLSDANIVSFSPGEWWEVQDEWIIQKRVTSLTARLNDYFRTRYRQ